VKFLKDFTFSFCTTPWKDSRLDWVLAWGIFLKVMQSTFLTKRATHWCKIKCKIFFLENFPPIAKIHIIDNQIVKNYFGKLHQQLISCKEIIW